ncbi:transposase [Paenibacillus larvae]|nr:transposase [Paenibacillus larvae]MCY9772989.1 transposase [Paenibacillus larvae]
MMKEVMMMKLLIILGSVIAPFLMILCQKIRFKFRLFFNVLAILSALVFGNISSISIYGIIKDQTVFMTNIHGIFLNPLFLLTGSYLGIYLIYRLALLALDETG